MIRYDMSKPNNNLLNKSSENIVRVYIMLIKSIQKVISDTLLLVPVPGVSSLISVIVSNPLYVLNLIFAQSHTKYQHNGEYFADVFASSYGFGTDFAEAIKIITSNTYNKIQKNIPILNNIESFNYLSSLSLLSLIADHPAQYHRIENIYNTLTDTFTKSDMPDNIKTVLLNDINSMRKAYSDAVSGQNNSAKHKNYGETLFWWIARTYFKSKKRLIDIDVPIDTDTEEFAKDMLNEYESDTSGHIKSTFSNSSILDSIKHIISKK
jgi:hypothetical protein